MQSILFIMFLITPPTAGKDPDWVLQNTNSMEFVLGPPATTLPRILLIQ